MKDKIMLLIIGVLIGAVIATGAFYIYTKVANTCDCSSNNIQMPNGQPPEKPSGENGEPPERPNDNNMQDSNQNNN